MKINQPNFTIQHIFSLNLFRVTFRTNWQTVYQFLAVVFLSSLLHVPSIVLLCVKTSAVTIPGFFSVQPWNLCDAKQHTFLSKLGCSVPGSHCSIKVTQ